MLFIESYKADVFDQSFEKLSGLTYEKKILTSLHAYKDLDDFLFIPNSKLFLFSGPEGYGKHTLANALSNDLYQYGYAYFLVDCEDIVDAGKEKEALTGIFSDIFHYTSVGEDEEGKPVKNQKFYIVFDNFDMICKNAEACKILKKSFHLLESDLSEYDCECIIAAITENGGDIPAGIRKYMNVFELGLPNEEERKEYFTKEFTFELEKAEKSVKFIPYDSETPAMVMAELTEGLSFSELRRVVFLGKLYYRKSIESQGGDFELYVENGIEQRNCFLKEEDVKAIVKNVLKGRVGSNVNTQTVLASPQIIYAPPQGMPENAYHLKRHYSPQPILDDEDFVDLELFKEIEKEQENLDEDIEEYDHNL